MLKREQLPRAQRPRHLTVSCCGGCKVLTWGQPEQQCQRKVPMALQSFGLRAGIRHTPLRLLPSSQLPPLWLLCHCQMPWTA